MDYVRRFGIASLTLSGLFVAACGGGSSGGSTPPAPSGLTYSTPPAFTVGKAITPLVPTVTGQVTSYTVSPALPAGLSVNASTGTIGGTPTAAATKEAYTVTASNSAGSTTASVTVVVNATAPTVAYASPAYSFTVGVASMPITPTVISGKVTGWAISPSLPPGLEFNSTTGAISGTPSSAAAVGTYVVTASNMGAPSTVNLSIAVASGPLIDLGHASALYFTRLVNNSLLSEDTEAHWILWNYSVGTQVASGNTTLQPGDEAPPLPVDLEGSTVVIQTSNGLEVRSAVTGTVSAEIATKPTWWKLASDGSYVCTGNRSGLTAWTTTGSVLLTIAGNYSNAVAFATSTQIQLANSPAGTNVIQTVSVPGGAAATSAQFQGSFQAWFADGSRFLSAILSTSGASAWWVYSPSAVQQDLASINAQSAGGSGNWYWWINGGTFNLSSVGSHGTVSNSFPVGLTLAPAAVAAANTVGVISRANYPAGQLVLIDLSGATPASSTYSLPFGDSTTYGATSASTWMVGTKNGVLVDGATLASTPRYLDYGGATSLAGSANNIVVATASGRILTLDPATHTLLGTINAQAGQLAVSSDGSVLATLAGGEDFVASTDDSVTLYQLPAGTVSASFPYDTTESWIPTAISLSGSGTVLGEIFDSATPCLAQTITVPGGSTQWCDTGSGVNLAQGNPISALLLTPDGSAVAEVKSSTFALGQTSIYVNGTLMSAVAAAGLAWLDNSEFLGAVLADGSHGEFYQGSYLYSSTGSVLTTLSTLPLLESATIIPASSTSTPATSIYTQSNGAGSSDVFSLTTGNLLWKSGSPSTGYVAGVVSGPYAVFVSQNLILAEPY